MSESHLFHSSTLSAVNGDLHGHRAEGLRDHTWEPVHNILCMGICSAANLASELQLAWQHQEEEILVLLKLGLQWPKIQLSCEYWYFLREIIQICCLLPGSGKKRQKEQSGKVCGTGSSPLVSGPLSSCWVDHPGNDLSAQSYMHCLPIFLAHGALYCHTSACKKQPSIDGNLLWNFFHVLQEQKQSSVTATACALPKIQVAWAFFSKLSKSYSSCH